MKKFLAILCVALMLCTLAACARNGKVENTETETETVTQPQPQTAPTPTPIPESETDPDSSIATETEIGTEVETATESPMTDFSAFFGMTRDEILGKRGESENTTVTEEDDKLYYTDHYAGYQGQAGYRFDQDGTLSDISLTFPEGVTLEDVTEALEGLHGASIDQNGVSTWHRDGIVYQMLQQDGKLVLRVTRQDTVEAPSETTATE